MAYLHRGFIVENGKSYLYPHSEKILNHSVRWSFVYLAISCHPVVCKTVNHELQHCPIQAAILHWNCTLSSEIPEEFRSRMFCHILWFDAICLWQSLLPLRFLNSLAKNRPANYRWKASNRLSALWLDLIIVYSSSLVFWGRAKTARQTME